MAWLPSTQFEIPLRSAVNPYTDLRSELNDKRAYFARWPNRTVRLRPETLRIACNIDVCDIMGEYDWAVIGGAGKKAGAALFHYRFSMGEPPMVVTEGGQVLR